MSIKKPAQLGDNLLSIRPRKGAAKPQTEEEAASAASVAETPEKGPERVSRAPARRRRRLSDKKVQLNIKIDQETFDRFIELSDEEEMYFGDLLKKLLDEYKDR